LSIPVRYIAVRFALLGLSPVVLVAQAGTAGAQQVLYGVTFDEELLVINPATGAGTLVGTIGDGAEVEAMGIATYNGELFVLDQIGDRLIVVNPLTGGTVRTVAVTDPFGLFGVYSEGDFEIAANGSAYYTESESRFNRLDLQTGVATQISNAVPSNIDGLALTPGGTMYAYQTGGQLYTIDPATGATTTVGPLNQIAGVYAGMEHQAVDNKLLTAIDSTLYTIDPATGAATVVGPIGFDKVSGLTFANVPEPATGALACGTLLLAKRRKRRYETVAPAARPRCSAYGDALRNERRRRYMGDIRGSGRGGSR
jgi:hypothetical protein